MKWLVLAVLLVLVLWIFLDEPIESSVREEAVGNYSVVTRDVGYLAGWNEGRVQRRTTQSYSIRYRGRPFELEGRGGMMGDEIRRYGSVNAVVTFDSSEPALIVNVGDPNNLNFHYLLREVDGQPSVELLTRNSGYTRARFADVADGGFVYRDPSQHHIHLSGGHWMLLGQRLVLDTRTFERYPIDSAFKAGVTIHEPLLMSPDRRSIVFRGSRYPELVIAVADFRTPLTYRIEVDRSRMRFAEAQQVDAAWVEHHFTWQPDDAGVDRLVARDNFEPLPFKGLLRPARSLHDSAMYTIEHVGKAMQRRLVEFIVDRFGGTRVEEDGEVIVVRLDDVQLRVAQRDNYVSLSSGFMERTERIDQIAAAFDGLLASGELDGFFGGTDGQ